jgi:translation initiation factor IF-3
MDRKPRYDKYNGDIVNERIHFPEVRLIGPNGEQLGVLSRYDAMKKAEEYELDLLCVAPNAQPPVCKLINYGKYRFEKQKQDRENKKNSKKNEVEIKEIQLTPQIGEHDLLTKVKAATKFLQDGNKLKVGVRFRGRQMAHIEVGEAVLNKFLDYVKEFGSTEEKPVLDGKNLSCVVASKVKKS